MSWHRKQCKQCTHLAVPRLGANGAWTGELGENNVKTLQLSQRQCDDNWRS